MKKYYVNVEIEMEDGALEFEWYSVSAPDEDTAVDKVYDWIGRNTDYREWCNILSVQTETPMLIADID